MRAFAWQTFQECCPENWVELFDDLTSTLNRVKLVDAIIACFSFFHQSDCGAIK